MPAPAFWRFTGADDRGALAPKLEAVIRGGLDRARTTSAKASWFNALRGIATTPPAVAWLEQVWSRKIKVPGLPLAEADEADLALELAVRGIPNAGDVLVTQLGRFQNPDRKARFAFVMPALSQDVAVRETFFDGPQGPARRRREAWVLEAARYLHHPLRAAASKKLVRPALDLLLRDPADRRHLLPEALGGRHARRVPGRHHGVRGARLHRRAAADYPPRLRWALLASADGLFRAARLSR